MCDEKFEETVIRESQILYSGYDLGVPGEDYTFKCTVNQAGEIVDEKREGYETGKEPGDNANGHTEGVS